MVSYGSGKNENHYYKALKTQNKEKGKFCSQCVCFFLVTFALENCSAVQNVVSQMFCSNESSFFLLLQQIFLIVFVDEKALSLTRITGIMCPGHHDDDDDAVVVVVVVDDNDDDDEQQHHHHHRNNNNNKYDKYCGGGWWSHAPSLLHSCDAWEELGRRLLGWRRKEREGMGGESGKEKYTHNTCINCGKL